MENQLRSRTKLTPAKKQGALGQFFGPEVAVAWASKILEKVGPMCKLCVTAMCATMCVLCEHILEPTGHFWVHGLFLRSGWFCCWSPFLAVTGLLNSIAGIRASPFLVHAANGSLSLILSLSLSLYFFLSLSLSMFLSLSLSVSVSLSLSLSLYTYI